MRAVWLRTSAEAPLAQISVLANRRLPSQMGASNPARFDAVTIGPSSNPMTDDAGHLHSQLKNYAIDWIKNIIM